MRFDIISALPKIYDAFSVSQIWQRAKEKGLLECHVHDLRDYTNDRHRTIDDAPYGGGAGMLLKIEPLVQALESLPKLPNCRILAASPKGRRLDQPFVENLAKLEQIIVISGRYEGIDQRFIDGWVDEEFSVGDYILSGGDLPAMVLMEAVGRLIPGVVGNQESITEDSFSSGLLKYPQYTRPPVFRGLEVPSVLRNGHHLDIEKWRKEQALKQTRQKRPDLL
ncbi:MAG: tRNA (guanosine(37)-N1)-methyltransferase TrmD [Bdellovibrionales bacterium]|nr:tRNA (guanosine(37)-N1)-methyltransferase TrmD [Bdellovibrionales bacterium]